MKLERSKIEFPLWRKKVDSSLFEHNGTTIPTWACTMWNIQEEFGNCVSKKDDSSNVIILFHKNEFPGNITVAKQGRKTPFYRLWYSKELGWELKHRFLMSYMRSLESRLSSSNGEDIEKKIPFWEFLDIEFNSAEKIFRFKAYYYQEPSFPELFKRIIGSPRLKQIDDELHEKGAGRIYKQSWKHRNNLPFELGAQNVIYWLLDTENKLFYVGEANDLVKRLNQRHSSIPKWNYYRYEVLPAQLAVYRVSLERMLIRGFAEILENKSDIECIKISEYQLANDKIDVG